ncbi:MAG TPA: SH3 domain-containing protein [Dongiaceae bacterium]|nr:SH3 domain-containing protein [Dongiaceae bacterium]
MKKSALTLAAVAAGLLALPGAASALTAVTTQPVPLRAGPAPDFPVVDSVPSDARVVVHGCVRAYRWCDISWRDRHGWLPGDELAYLDDGRRVSIIEYGPTVGLPIIAFSVDSYWDRYYRGRPFYRQRSHWRTVWREHDHREGRSERRSDRNATERLREKRSYRSTEQERKGTTEHRRSERRGAHERSQRNERTERNRRLQNSHGYRSMDTGREGTHNRVTPRSHGTPERSSQNFGRSHGGPGGGSGGISGRSGGSGPSDGGGRPGAGSGGHEGRGR